MIDEDYLDVESFYILRIPGWNESKTLYKPFLLGGRGNIDSDYVVCIFKEVEIHGHKKQIDRLCKQTSNLKITESQLIEKLNSLCEK